MDIKNNFIKKILCIVLSIFSIFSNTYTQESNSILAIVIMVKDEQDVLEKSLQAYAKAGIDSYLIYDTGSTDNTVKVAYDFFEKYNIKDGHVFKEPFIDFSASRNRALDIAEKQFPEAQFLLMPDAEWYINNAEELLKFCKKQDKAHKAPYYLVRIFASTALDFYVSRLISTGTQARFKGKVHEVINHLGAEKVPDHIYFEYSPTGYGKSKTAKRWKRDRDILLEEYKENPYNTRTIFYLAQTYVCLFDLDNAYKYYKLRAELKGWGEEDFIAWYRLGQVTQMRIGKENSKIEWKEALGYYLHAYSLRPHRAEPLTAIAQYYWDNNNYPLCYLFAKQASEIEYPKSDILFIEKYLYDYVRWDLLGRAAYYVNHYEVGEQAICKALKYNPKATYLWNNLKYYISACCN